MKHTKPFILAVLLLVAGCLKIGDFGIYWDKGFIDPALEGQWQNARPNGSSVTFTNEGDLYHMEFSTDPDKQFARTLKVNESNFLMTKKKLEENSGNLIPYVIEGGNLVLFAANKDKQIEFNKRYPDIPFAVTRTGISIDQLNDETMKWLEQITSEPEWWIDIQSYKR